MTLTAASKPRGKPKGEQEADEYEYTYEYTSDKKDTTVKNETKEEGEAAEGGKDTKQEGTEWKGGQGKFGMLKESSSKRADPRNLNYIGGMRNPAEVVEGMPCLESWTPHPRRVGTFCQNQPSSDGDSGVLRQLG